MRQAWAWFVLLLLAASLAPAAGAYHGQPGRAGLVVDGPVEVDGLLSVAASPGAAFWTHEAGFDAHLQAARVEVDLVVWRATDGPLSLVEPERAHTTRATHEGVDARLTPRGESFQFLAFQSGASRVRAFSDEGGRIVAQPPGGVAPTLDAQEDGLHRFGDAMFLWGLDRPGARLEAAAPRVEAVGDFTLFLYDGLARFDGPDGETTTYRTGAGDADDAPPTPDADASLDPDAPLRAAAGDERWVAYAILRVQDGLLTVAPSAGFHALYGAHLDADLNGTAKLPTARGSATIGGQRVDTAGPTALQGVLRASFEPAAAAANRGSGDDALPLRMQASGDVSAFAIPGATYRYEPPVVGIGAALVALGAALWFVKSGGAAALYSRFAGPQVLRHEDRDRALALVRENPGMSVADLAERLDVSWSTASYHLGVLEREGMLVGERRGRHKRYVVVGSGIDRRALAVAAHPTAQALLDAVGREPGISQTDLAARAGITPSTASWHLKRLAQAGLVRVEKVWRTARYHLPSPSDADASAQAKG